MGTSDADNSDAVWRIEMLGGLRARRADQVLDHFQTQKTACLLAYLAFYPEQTHNREKLADMLWPDAEIDAARNRLSQAVGWLRGRLEPEGAARNSVLIADRLHVGLNPAAVVTDAAEFEAALRAAGAASAPEEQMRWSRQAVDLYRGELLPGFYEDWALAERARLATLYTEVLRRLFSLYERSEEWDKALDFARRALATDPLEERLHCDLMHLLAASGQPAMALRHFREMERLFEKEFGEAPSAATYALIDTIRQSGASSGLPTSGARAARSSMPAASLPSPITRFFGRDSEMEAALAPIRARRTRFITLTGVGGAGKTRLAIELASQLIEHFQSAVWFVPLAETGDARLIPETIADILRLPRSSATKPLDQIVDALSSRPSLLVLDNLEHLLQGSIPVIQDLLSRLPALTLLVTSRQKLNLEGEREIAVQPLPVPVEFLPIGSREFTPEQLMQVAGVQLFVDRVQAVRPAFALTRQNAETVAQLCSRLDGLPLAIELCAAWAQTLSPAQMLEQLTRRFDLLVSRRNDIAPRHRTLRAALEYSYLLLPEEMQRLFAQLSVFRGGWTLAGAAAVCFDDPSGSASMAALAAITELRERSLIVAEESADSPSAEMRYGMLETLREFAAQQLTLSQEVPLRRRHAEYHASLVEMAEVRNAGPDQTVWLSRLEAEHDNVREALAWSLSGQIEGQQAVEIGLRLASASAPFWEMRGYVGEGQDWLERLLAASTIGRDRTDRSALRAKARNAQALLLRARGEFSAAETSANEALRIWQTLADEAGMTSSLQLLATLAYSREQYDRARSLLEEALRLARTIDKRPLIAAVLLSLGNVFLELCDWPKTWAYYSESLELCRALGNRKRIADALNNLGLVARYRGELLPARTLMEESLTLCRELSDRSGTAITLLNLGTVHLLDGRFREARALLKEAIAMTFEVDNKRALAWCVKEFGHLACAEKRYASGIRLLSASESMRKRLGMSFHPADPEQLTRDAEMARSFVGDEAFDRIWQEGTALSATDAFVEALRYSEGEGTDYEA